MSKRPDRLNDLDKIHAILLSDDLAEKDGDLLQLRWAWNQRRAELDEPFYIQANLISYNQTTIWLANSYRILANSTVTAAEIPVDILVVERIDSTNSHETYTGLAHAGATEAIVIVDRTFDRVVEELWPLLDGETSPTATRREKTVEAVMLDAILAEFHQHLRPEHIERLIATAPLRHLETLCDAPPPADLTARARALEQTLFNRTQPVTLPADYPTRVSIQHH